MEMADEPLPSKRRRANLRLPSPIPVDYIDLTADSPTINNRPRLDNDGNHKTINVNAVTFREMETIVVDEVDTPPRQRPHRKQTAKNKSPNVPNSEQLEDSHDKKTQSDPGDRIPHINDSFNGSPTVLTCPICYEELKSSIKPTSTKCGHIFCECCIKAAIEKRKKCPVCMTSITLKSCIRLHF